MPEPLIKITVSIPESIYFDYAGLAGSDDTREVAVTLSKVLVTCVNRSDPEGLFVPSPLRGEIGHTLGVILKSAEHLRDTVSENMSLTIAGAKGKLPKNVLDRVRSRSKVLGKDPKVLVLEWAEQGVRRAVGL